MAAQAQINANCLNMQFFMSRVNLPALRSPELGAVQGEAGCKSVSKQHNWPNLPRQPNPPEQKNNRHNLRGKKPELLMVKQLTKNHHRQSSQFGLQFSANSRARTLLSRYFESNSRQFETIGANSRQNLKMQNSNPLCFFYFCLLSFCLPCVYPPHADWKFYVLCSSGSLVLCLASGVFGLVSYVWGLWSCVWRLGSCVLCLAFSLICLLILILHHSRPHIEQ
jgi:hypothetical protein